MFDRTIFAELPINLSFRMAEEGAPEGYNDYVELINFNREEGDINAANETREEFAQRFPLHSKIWLEWIEYVYFARI